MFTLSFVFFLHEAPAFCAFTLFVLGTKMGYDFLSCLRVSEKEMH